MNYGICRLELMNYGISRLVGSVVSTVGSEIELNLAAMVRLKTNKRSVSWGMLCWVAEIKSRYTL
jgi:hypothetical protein